MKYFLLGLVTIGALVVAVMAVQASQASAAASAAQAGATAEVGAALLQAQCLGGLAGLLGLAAGVGLGFWWRKRVETQEKQRLEILMAQMRAAQQPRRANGQFRRPAPQYPMLPQPPYVVGQPMPMYYYPQQVLPQPQQPQGEPMIIEIDDPANDADYLSQWGF